MRQAAPLVTQEVLHLKLDRLQRQELLEREVVRHVEVSNVDELAEHRHDHVTVHDAQLVDGQRLQAVLALAQRTQVLDMRVRDVQVLEQLQVLNHDLQSEFVELCVTDVETVQVVQLRQRHDDAELGTVDERAAADVERAQVRQAPLAQTADQVVDGHALQSDHLQLVEVVRAQHAQPLHRERRVLQAHLLQTGDVAREQRHRPVGETTFPTQTLEQLVGQLAVEEDVGRTEREAVRRFTLGTDLRLAEGADVLADVVETNILKAAGTLVHLLTYIDTQHHIMVHISTELRHTSSHHGTHVPEL